MDAADEPPPLDLLAELLARRELLRLLNGYPRASAAR
jgi:hypothetical protein